MDSEDPAQELMALPRYARELIREANCEGRVSEIQVRPKKGAPPVSVASWNPESDQDHSRSRNRAVTLFQKEHLAAIESYLGRPVRFAMTRRNVCIESFNLEIGRGAQLRIGELMIELTDRCHPCSRMNETIGPGGFAAMFGHGGWTARIIRPAAIHVGDRVSLALTSPG